MARFVFHESDVDLVPYDLDGDTIDWRSDTANGLNSPVTVADGITGPARRCAGSHGWVGVDSTNRLLGHRGVTVRVWVRVDAAAMAGTTGTIWARGQGGPAVPDLWAYGLEAEVNGAGDEVTFRWSWQDPAGVERPQQGVTLEVRPGAWWLVSASREVTGDRVIMRFTINGQDLGVIESYDTEVVAATGAAISIGARVNGAAYDQFFSGDIDALQVLGEATTARAEWHVWRHQWDLMRQLRGLVPAFWWQGDVLPAGEPGAYRDYRIVPVAAALADVVADIERVSLSGVGHHAYGAQLARWERSLDLTPAPMASIEERQIEVAAAMHATQGFSVAALTSYARTLFDVPDPDHVAVLERANVWTPAISSSPSSGLSAPWRVVGNGSATRNASSMAIDAAAQDLRYSPGGHKSFLAELGVPYSRAFILATVNAVVSSPTTWFGITARQINDVAWLAPVDVGGGTWELRARRYSTATLSLGSWSTLGALGGSGPWDLALCHDGAVWVARSRNSGGGVADWTTYAMPLAPSAPGWLGLGIAGELASGGAVQATVTFLSLASLDSAYGARWAAWTDIPRYPNAPRHTALLERRSPAGCAAGATYDDVALYDSTGSFFDWSLGVLP